MSLPTLKPAGLHASCRIIAVAVKQTRKLLAWLPIASGASLGALGLRFIAEVSLTAPGPEQASHSTLSLTIANEDNRPQASPKHIKNLPATTAISLLNRYYPYQDGQNRDELWASVSLTVHGLSRLRILRQYLPNAICRDQPLAHTPFYQPILTKSKPQIISGALSFASPLSTRRWEAHHSITTTCEVKLLRDF
ncbi:hypothetical protein OH491_07270 [Termitidicoccus mucosus]|uniref:hypothetical protein n=1 Tax=Termitidicoccus mucosus TaxID=1184151 RepID=UPI0031845510